MASEGSREVIGTRNGEGHAIATKIGDLGNNSKHEGRRERVEFTSPRSEAERNRVEGMALQMRVVGQLKKAIGFERCHAVKAHVGTAESIEGEAIFT